MAQRLYLGDYRSGRAALAGVKRPVEPEGTSAPFRGVVSLCEMPLFPDEPVDSPIDASTEWLQIPIQDGGRGEREFELAFALALPFIRLRHSEGNVLVHCAAGMSRSVSVLAGWLCDEEGAEVTSAYEQIATAKARALGVEGIDPLDFIAPAAEFRSYLQRRFEA